MDPSRWQVSEDAVRNLERVRKVRNRLRECLVVVALILLYFVIALVWI